MRVSRRATRYTVVLLTAVVAGFVAFFVYLTRSSSGQDLVLGRVMDRIERLIDGEVSVDRLTSTGLLRNATLHDIRMGGKDGRPLLEADSISVEYSLADLLENRFIFSNVEIWNPVVSIVRTSADSAFNAWEVLRLGGSSTEPVESADSTLPPGETRVSLSQVTVHGGLVRVLYPLSPDAPPNDRILTVPDPNGGSLRSLTFREFEAQLSVADLMGPELEGLHLGVEALSVEGSVFTEPLSLRDFAGLVDLRDGRVLVTADRYALPASEGSALATVDLRADGGPSLSLDVTSQTVNLADLRWLVPSLPDATGRGRFAVELSNQGLALGWEGAELAFSRGTLSGQGQYRRPRRGDWSVESAQLDMTDLPLSTIEDFLGSSLPIQGRLTGSLELDGMPQALRVGGRLVLSGDSLAPNATGASFGGTIHLAEPIGATEMQADFLALDYGLVQEFAPGIRIDGTGPATVSINGRLDEGIRIDARMEVVEASGTSSSVSAEGTVRQALAGGLSVDLQIGLEPLSFTAIHASWGASIRLGSVTGSLHAWGPLRDLRAEAELETDGGALRVTSRFALDDPFAGYRVTAEGDRFAVASVFPQVPEGTLLSGRVVVAGAGGDAGTAELRGSMELGRSRFGVIAIDTTVVDVRVSGGMITFDTLSARIGGVDVEGQGTLSVSEGRPPGEMTVAYSTASLEGLRPLFMGEDIIARDTLSTLEREFLIFDGVDPDTLPNTDDVRMAGQLQGVAVLTGSLDNLGVAGDAAFTDASYGRNSVSSASVSFNATSLPSRRPRIEAEIEADSVRLLQRAFASGSVRLDYRASRGNLDVFLTRNESEDYRARVAFESDSASTVLHLDELGIRFPDARWNLGRPATIAWDPDGLSVQGFQIRRPGSGGLRFTADGRLPFRGTADLDLAIERLDLQRLASLLQLPDTLRGIVDLDAKVTGTAEVPEIVGTFAAENLEFRRFSFVGLEGSLDFAGQQLGVDLRVSDGDHGILTVKGDAPAEIALSPFHFSIPDAPIDLDIVADSMPASVLLGLVGGLDEVSGVLEGSVSLQGTAHHLAPSGRLVLRDGGAVVPGLGVRHRDAQATLDLSPDGDVAVVATAVSGGGRVDVTGTVSLSPVTNPDLDLTIRMDGFRGVNRRDVTGRLSGEATLTGTYQEPLVSGRLDLDEGTLFVEEFLRAAEVIDLADTTFFDVIDPGLVEARRLLGGGNPFLRNIRMENFIFGVSRDSWIRSPAMNVELGGELQVFYDRENQDLAMFGSLQAVRGTYTVVGRQFQVDGGNLLFVGTPGVNPGLNIQAVNRLRTSDGTRLTINATVTGTLVSPRVQLSSDEASVGQEDLLSYLLTGRPAYALGSGQSAQVQGAAGVLGGAATIGLNTLSNRLGNAMAQSLGLGLDYMTVTQQDVSTVNGVDLAGSLGTTVIETGRYLAEDFFVTLLLRPVASSGGGNTVAGLRLEWATTDNIFVESFVEDRFFRNRVVGFGDVGLQSARGVGLFIFREWGY